MAVAHSIVETIAPGDLVFDIGANLGDKAAWFADRGARVVCVEPQPELVRQLHTRFADRPNVTVIGKGVGAQPGTAELAICNQGHVFSTFAEHWKRGRFAHLRWDASVAVEMTTLDALVAEFGRPVYCKIDVEGYELDVIRGLSAAIGCISCEFTIEFAERDRQVFEHLSRLGYREFNLAIAEEPCFRFNKWKPLATIFSEIERLATGVPMLWGDIYARCG